MAKALKWMKHEARELLPAFVFFSLAFCIVVVTDALYVKGYHIQGFHIAGALILALIVSKAMLLANMLPFVDAFPNRPLIYNTVWKTSVYTVTAVFIYFMERIIRTAAMHARLTNDPSLTHGIPWPRFWAVLIWLVVVFLVFVSYSELDRRLGNGKLRRMFFGSRRGGEG